MKRIFKVFGIKWDVDSKADLKHLPKEMRVVISSNEVCDIMDEEEIEEYISDFISDETGYCHDGFNYKEIR